MWPGPNLTGWGKGGMVQPCGGGDGEEGSMSWL